MSQSVSLPLAYTTAHVGGTKPRSSHHTSLTISLQCTSYMYINQRATINNQNQCPVLFQSLCSQHIPATDSCLRRWHLPISDWLWRCDKLQFQSRCFGPLLSRVDPEVDRVYLYSWEGVGYKINFPRSILDRAAKLGDAGELPLLSVSRPSHTRFGEGVHQWLMVCADG